MNTRTEKYGCSMYQLIILILNGYELWRMKKIKVKTGSAILFRINYTNGLNEMYNGVSWNFNKPINLLILVIIKWVLNVWERSCLEIIRASFSLESDQFKSPFPLKCRWKCLTVKSGFTLNLFFVRVFLFLYDWYPLW